MEATWEAENGRIMTDAQVNIHLLMVKSEYFPTLAFPAVAFVMMMSQHRFGEVMRAYANKYNVQKGRNFDDERDYLLPIPQGERDKSNNILTQNPKY